MSEVERPSTLRVIVGATIDVMIVVGPIALFEPAMLIYLAASILVVVSPAGPIIGAYSILVFVRWINRRDDPRLVKPPVDTP